MGERPKPVRLHHRMQAETEEPPGMFGGDGTNSGTGSGGEGGEAPGETHRLHVGVELIRVPEVLFQPSLVGSDQAGLVDTIEYILKQYGSRDAERLAADICLCGGTASLKGIVCRLSREIVQIRPFQSKVSIRVTKSPAFGSWFGLRDIASNGDLLSSCLITAADYKEKGAEYLRQHSSSNPYFRTPLPNLDEDIESGGLISMSRLKLYFDTLSQPSRSLLIFLQMNKIPFEPKLIRLGKGEQNSPEFLKINPLHQVPIIDDNGFILRESVGILRYLCREKSVADHWYPRNSKRQAKVDEYLEWQHLGTRLGCGMYFRLMWLEPLSTGQTPDLKEVQRYKALMINVCDSIEKNWLKNKYICGDEISIADLLAACELEQPKLAGYDPREGRPNLAEFMARVREATNPAYDEAHKIINAIVQKHQGQVPQKEKKTN